MKVVLWVSLFFIPLFLLAKNKVSFKTTPIGLISVVEIESKKYIEFRKDEFAGPTLWLNNSRLPIVVLDNAKGIYGQNDSVSYRIEYKIENEKFQINLQHLKSGQRPVQKKFVFGLRPFFSVLMFAYRFSLLPFFPLLF